MGVLEGHCERLGRDPSEITKTRLGTVMIAPTQEEADRQGRARARERRVPDERLGTAIVGDPDTIGEKVQELLDAGLDGLMFGSPETHDLETVAADRGDPRAAMLGRP